MWPFKKEAEPIPESVSNGKLSAHFDSRLKCWVIPFEGIDFHLPGIPLNEGAFTWVEEISTTLRSLSREIQNRAEESVEIPCDKSKGRVLTVYMDSYLKSKRLEIDFGGDASWGDLWITMVIENGVILDSFVQD